MHSKNSPFVDQTFTVSQYLRFKNKIAAAEEYLGDGGHPGVCQLGGGTHSVFHYSLQSIATSFSRPLILCPVSVFSVSLPSYRRPLVFRCYTRPITVMGHMGPKRPTGCRPLATGADWHPTKKTAKLNASLSTLSRIIHCTTLSLGTQLTHSQLSLCSS